MESGEEEIIDLLSLAEYALAEEEADSEKFLKSLARYLDALEFWRAALAKSDSPQPTGDGVKSALGRLNETHQRLLERSNLHREKLMSEMGTAQKKAKALRSYVDRFPERITIAGKRKG